MMRQRVQPLRAEALWREWQAASAEEYSLLLQLPHSSQLTSLRGRPDF